MVELDYDLESKNIKRLWEDAFTRCYYKKNGEYPSSAEKDDEKYEKNFESLNTIIQELLTYGEKVEISVNCNYTNPEETIAKINDFISYSNLPAENIKINLKDKRDYIYEEDEIEQLKKVDDYCSQNNLKMNVKLGEMIGKDTLDNIIFARNSIENFVEKLNSITVKRNGVESPLSPIEKYFVIHKFVSNRVYNLSDDLNDDKKRNWVGVLTSDQVICSGFASLLKCVCDRAFQNNEIKCFCQGCYVTRKDNSVGPHANNILIVKDDIYGINGVYISDACWDAMGPGKDSTSIAHALNPLQLYSKHKEYTFNFQGVFLYDYIDGISSNMSFDQNKIVDEFVDNYGLISKEEISNNIDKDKIEQVLNNQGITGIKAVWKFRETFDEMVEKQYQEQKDQFVEKNKDFLFAPQIPKEAIKNGIKAIAVYADVTSAEQMEEYVNAQMKRYNEMQNECFDLTEISQDKTIG